MYCKKRSTRILTILLALVFGIGAFYITEFSKADSAYAVTSSFSISGHTVPTTVKKGSGFILKGVVKSSVKMDSIRVGVINSKGEWVKGASYVGNPGSTTFNIASIDSKVKFGILANGTYTYRVWAKDVNGGRKNIINKSFTVNSTGKATTSSSSTASTAGSAITISGHNYPTTLAVGKSFTIKGTVKSNKTMRFARVGVVNTSGKWMTGVTYTKNPNSKTYNLKLADPYIKFGKLAAGTYYYRVAVTDVSGYSKFVLNKKFTVTSSSSPATMTDAQFDAYLTNQGFPASYKASLKALHKAHPTWKFVAQKTGLSWGTVLEKQKKVGINLVEPTSKESMKSKASNVYNAKTGKYTVFDGRWNQASDKAIAYYLDPRNFINETAIYMFMDHRYSAASGNKTQIKNLVSSNTCFMNTTTYINYIYNAGVAAKVNPSALAAMVINEQGWKGGSGLISGKYPGYVGYYNHFNIGAYTTSSMNAVQRGLWYAKGAGTGATSYGRPWNSIEKSLKGGALFYKEGYLDKKQYTYYTKKFNVLNGSASVATHQYMTGLLGAYNEGVMLKNAYKNSNTNITFYIPVYNGMPSAKCPAP